MQAKEKLEKPLKWFVLPNESYKWDFILEKYVVENAEQEATSESRGIEQLAEDGFDKDYIVTHKRRKQQDRFYY
ncbi:MAG: hypothetical protein WAL97_07985 [Halobacteriota archaeon]